MDDRVEIVEVGPRDGLQNESAVVATEVKVELIRRLAACGLRRIEAAACVSPKRVPQMADHAEVLAALPESDPVIYGALVANARGLETATRSGRLGEIAVFTAASDAFARRNINRSVAESLADFRPLVARAKSAGLRARGYVSTAIACPYAGAVRPEATARVAAALAETGCDEISLGDTIGVGTPATVAPMLRAVLREVPARMLAGHFHDTFGAAVANIACAMEFGLRVFDSSVAGLGGCPFAPGASGNAATEDAAWFFQSEGMTTGVDPQALAETGAWLTKTLGRKTVGAKAGAAILARKRREAGTA